MTLGHGSLRSSARRGFAPSSRAPCPVSIAGAGNWLVPHDAIGPRVIEHVSQRYGSDVELLDIGSSALGLLDHLHGQDLLVVVDAGLYDAPPGEVRLVDPDLASPPAPALSVHQIGPLEALSAAKLICPERLPQRTLLLLVQTEGLDHEGEEATLRRVTRALDRVVGAYRACTAIPTTE
jgi:hydrogenase maturation protease